MLTFNHNEKYGQDPIPFSDRYENYKELFDDEKTRTQCFEKFGDQKTYATAKELETSLITALKSKNEALLTSVGTTKYSQRQ